MKTIITTIALIFAMNFAMAQQKVTVEVDGMGCAFCAYGLEKQFKKLDGIADINIKFEDALLTFTIGSITEEQVIATVKKAGYKAVKVTIEEIEK